MAAKGPVTRILITAKDEASAVFGSIRRNAVKLAAAIAGFFSAKIFSNAVTAAESFDVQMRKLSATIRATGGAAGLTAEEIDQLARDLDEATLGSAEGFRNAANALLTFKSIGRDSFGTVLELAADLEAAGFGTLESNAVQLGKALEDPIKGLTALTRSGVSFTAEQQAVIKSLVETGRVAEAQGIILDAVAGQVGGVARAAGGGLSGAIDLVGKRLQDLREQLGNAVLPVFQRFNERIAETYKRLSDSGVIKRFGEIIANVFDAAQEKVFAFLDSFDLDSLVTNVSEFTRKTQELFSGWGESLQGVSNVARVAFDSIASGLNVLRAAFFGSVGIVSTFYETFTNGFAAVLETLARVRPSLAETAAEVRAFADSFGDTARRNFEKAAIALDDTAASSERLKDSFSELIGIGGESATAVDDVANAAGNAAAQIELSADALDALGEGFEYVGGQAAKASAGIAESGSAANKAAQDLIAAEAAANALEEAYKLLGVTSQSALNKSADDAKLAFERIRDSGGATPQILAQAWEGYAQKAIAANGGVATSVIKAQAALYGMRVESSTTGDELVGKLSGASGALTGLGDEAQTAAGRLKLITDEAERAAAAVEKLSRIDIWRGQERTGPSIVGPRQSLVQDNKTFRAELAEAALKAGSRR